MTTARKSLFTLAAALRPDTAWSYFSTTIARPTTSFIEAASLCTSYNQQMTASRITRTCGTTTSLGGHSSSNSSSRRNRRRSRPACHGFDSVPHRENLSGGWSGTRSATGDVERFGATRTTIDGGGMDISKTEAVEEELVRSSSSVPLTHEHLPDESIYILDGTSMLFRAYYGRGAGG